MTHRAKVLTVSDGVHEGVRIDRSGAALAERLADSGFDVVECRVVADGVASVQGALLDMSAHFTGLIVTTGGTGFGPRDLTPEGTRSVIERSAPGLAEAMRQASNREGPFGMLSRGVCGTAGRALICNLPGSESGALECLEVILPAVGHILELLAGGRPH
ncbi:MAG: MogA/MoaB family molybdenum cofactor biosynthesis protein [Acidimicrobiia bacterium]